MLSCEQMAASWSCKFIYFNEVEATQEICTNSSQELKQAGLSVSRPLHYTITMSSGSSGADTFSSMSESDGIFSASSSEPSTRAGTPPESPAYGKYLLSPPLLMIPAARLISPTLSKHDLGYDAENDSSFCRLALDSGESSPFEGSRDGDGMAVVDFASMWQERINEVRARVVEESYSGMRGDSGSDLGEGQGGDKTEHTITTRSSLQRSRRPPPLDLSSISCTRVQPRQTGANLSPVSNDSPSTPVRRPYTAPVIQTMDSEMEIELSQQPATAPCLTMPKAPRIRPSVMACARTPSPLMLPSPYIPWSIDETQSSTASTPSILWSAVSPTPASPSIRVAQPRRVSLGRKIVELRGSLARAPVPPSLRNSPILTQVTSPLLMAEFPPISPLLHSVFDNDIMPPPARFGTPLTVHRNPYFSHEISLTSKDEHCCGEDTVEVDVFWPLRKHRPFTLAGKLGSVPKEDCGQ